MMRRMVTFMVLAAVLVLGAACGQVTEGERGIFFVKGVIDQKSYGPGWYPYFPGTTDMDIVDVKVQKFEAKKLGSATSDVQEVHADIVVNYRLDADNVHKLIAEYGYDYVGKVLHPAILDALKAGTAHFKLESIIRDREKLRAMIKDDLAARMKPQYIIVTDVNLTNFDVSKEFAAAVERKQVAEQNVTTATREAEKVREAAKGEADAKREQAKGVADKLRIEGDAQAAYNAKVSASLTPALIQQMAIEAWKAGGSQVPKISGAGGVLLQVPMPEAAKK